MIAKQIAARRCGLISVAVLAAVLLPAQAHPVTKPVPTPVTPSLEQRVDRSIRNIRSTHAASNSETSAGRAGVGSVTLVNSVAVKPLGEASVQAPEIPKIGVEFSDPVPLQLRLGPWRTDRVRALGLAATIPLGER